MIGVRKCIRINFCNLVRAHATRGNGDLLYYYDTSKKVSCCLVYNHFNSFTGPR